MTTHPDCNIIVSGGSAARDAFLAILNREAEIVMQSHDADTPEKEAAHKKGITFTEHVVGWGGIAIVTNPANPVNELTTDQIRKLFSGEYTNWSQAGGPNLPVQAFSVSENRIGTVEFFTRDFLKAPLASNTVIKAYFLSIVPAVEELKGGLGYLRLRNLTQLQEKGLDSRIKVIAVKKDADSPAIVPSRTTVNNGSYPITRPYFLYSDGNLNGKLTKRFIEFCAAKNPRSM
jgi:phosphate transport system substrate-binding protein